MATDSKESDPLIEGLIEGEIHSQRSVVRDEEPKEAKCSDPRNWIAFFILGTINNLTYVVIGSAAQDIARAFNADNLIGLIPWANVALGFVVRILNAWAFERLPHWIRIFLMTAMTVGGTILLAFSTSFVIAIVAIVAVGGASSFGESVLLGFLHKFAPRLVGGWSSGTGMAGVGGSLLYLGFAAGGLSLQLRFLLLLPFSAVYVLIFLFMIKKRSHYDHEEAVLTTPVNETKAPEGWRRTWRCFKQVWWLSTQLALVYFFEYVVSTGCADKAEQPGAISSPVWVVRNSFTVLAFCYQFGVLISRSSLSCITFRRVEILTALQCANMLLWIMQDVYKFMDVWVQFVLMVYCGLLGGAMYVNVFYLLLHDPDIAETDRELCVNICALFQTLGICVASGFIILMDNTFLAQF